MARIEEHHPPVHNSIRRAKARRGAPSQTRSAGDTTPCLALQCTSYGTLCRGIAAPCAHGYRYALGRFVLWRDTPDWGRMWLRGHEDAPRLALLGSVPR